MGMGVGLTNLYAVGRAGARALSRLVEEAVRHARRAR
jgi:hypothetical protein